MNDTVDAGVGDKVLGDASPPTFEDGDTRDGTVECRSHADGDGTVDDSDVETDGETNGEGDGDGSSRILIT